MAKAYLKLEKDDGSFLEFRKEKIKARWVKEVIKVQKKAEELEKAGDVEGQLDLMIDFVVDFFKKPKLTADAILDGLESDQLLPTLNGIFTDILGGTAAEPGE